MTDWLVMTPTQRKTKQEMVAEFRVTEILDAARKVFARKGFAETTVDQIAEEAGVAKGTVYLYFPSKRDIYFAALREGAKRMSEILRRNIDAVSTVEQKLQAYFDTKLRYINENLDFFRILHAEFGTCVHAAALDNEIGDLIRAQVQFIADVLRSGVASGELRPIAVDAVAWALSEMTRGVAVRRVLGWTQNPVEDDVAELTKLAWNGIRNNNETL